MTVATVKNPSTERSDWKSSLAPLVLDIGLPVAAYYVSKDVVGTSMLTALVASSAVSLVRTAYTTVRDRAVNTMSMLVLAVNLAGIALSFVSGSVRVTSGKDAVISSVIAFGILVSVRRGRPALAEGLRPFVTRGDSAAHGAWERLMSTSPASTASSRFQRLVGLHSVIFGVAFLADCVVRLVCAAVAPLSVLGWIGTACTVAAFVVGSIVSGALTVDPLQKLVTADADRD